MKTKKNYTKNVAVISGTLVTGLVAGLATNDVNANNLFDYSSLGTGYELRNELIDMKNIEFVDHQEYIRVEDKDGNFISVFTDLDKLEIEMLKKAPEDKELINWKKHPQNPLSHNLLEHRIL